MQVRVKRYDPSAAEPSIPHQEVPVCPTLKDQILAHCHRGMTVLDVGCGDGRLGFQIADQVGEVIGCDLSPTALAEAEAYQAKHQVRNISLVECDAERADYLKVTGRGRLHMVVSHLCMSDAIMARAHAALRPGDYLIFSAFHTDQWKETGRPSRFAYSKERVQQVLKETGFTIEFLEGEQEITEFNNRQEITDGYLAEGCLKERWMKDGRWQGLLRYLDAGGLSLTTLSRVIVTAQRGH